jgi:hypothetical protein
MSNTKVWYADNLNDAEAKEQYQVTISSRFAALENLDDNVDVNRTWKNIRENIKISVKLRLGHCDLKQHKPRFDKECSKLLDRGKHTKLQWMQNPSQR